MGDAMMKIIGFATLGIAWVVLVFESLMVLGEWHRQRRMKGKDVDFLTKIGPNVVKMPRRKGW